MKKKLLVLFLPIALCFSGKVIAQNQTINATILSSSDDAEEEILGGAMDLSSSDIEFTNDGGTEQIVGLRYDNLNIPNGSTIISAYIQFTTDEITTGNQVDVVMAFEDVANASAITSGNGDLSGRTYFGTSNAVLWTSIQDWATVGANGPAQQSPDLAAMLQIIVNKAGWSAGNAVLLGMVDPAVMNVPGYTGNTAKRTAESYDGSGGPVLHITYIPSADYQTGNFPVPTAAAWKFNDLGVDLTATNWTGTNYDDTAWVFGNGILGYGDSPNTTLSYGADPNNKYPTYYFRHIFNVSDASIYDSLVFNLLADDGAIVYLNGTEVYRTNLPATGVTYNTLAPNVISGADETTYFETKVNNTLLVNGINVVAVELHQNTLSSSDLSFDLSLGYELPPLSATTYPMAENGAWHYLDNGTSLDAVNWTVGSFDVSNWEHGPAGLGYTNTNVVTNLSFGPDPLNKYITTYFRRDIDIDLALLPDSVQLGLLRDDGAIVYINGVEIRRDNLAAGTISAADTALVTVSGSDETHFYTSNFSKNLFVQGVNTIAVELHQATSNSSDLGFDMFLKDAPIVNPPALGCAGGLDAHIGCFTSITPTGQTSNLIIPNGSHRFQAIFKQGDAYLDSVNTVPGNHDFTAYVGKNGSSVIGHLSVNHENTPGGVSILDVHYTDSTKLWSVDTIKKVDLYNSDLVTTTRNCSGGITPWGTILTAEESTNSGDVNGDGYEDVGWLVEIDPETAMVRSYGNGMQEKLWACGRISHENALILNDSITLYTGEDGGSSAVFKFVADNPADLSAGTLYALVLDAPLINNDPSSTTATWVQIPNTTTSDRNNTRTLAQGLGATNFNGVEDIEVNPITGQIYFAAKGKSRVYRFTDNGATVADFETFVGGTDYVLNTESGVYTEPWANGNDNLTFDDQGNLWVLQDGGLNYIWMVRPDHTQATPMVELFASFPVGSEPTGLTFSPDYKFGFVSVQHPSSSNTAQQDATLNNIAFDKSTTFVFSRDEFLGAQEPIAGFTTDNTTIYEGNTVTFTDTSLNYPTSRLWLFNGGTPTNSTNKVETVTFNTAGDYDIELYVSNVAGNDTEAKVNHITVLDPLGLDKTVFSNTLRVYPNPTAEILNVALDLKGTETVSITLFDLSGKLVANLVDASTGTDKWSFNLAAFGTSNQSLILEIKVDENRTTKVIQFNK
ncbi:hypothetical protein DNU06_14480 [Putridiphycobacter roseus]|uniref:PKD domain-containing protein n=1 Tax=Putridiphycobacter roseus TaxID=2219161 RepID=A0A2W1NDL5_9FLAO|nr:alkaline phosphatase PhoX [Putridiphycobacter roseus]PZE16166.1 hypothetical protein DNU06_14480 [Putridiphycobacter roseus]